MQALRSILNKSGGGPLIGLAVGAALLLAAGAATAGEARRQFQFSAPVRDGGTGTVDVEMRKELDFGPLNAFRGTADRSSGYTVLRDLKGNTVRGYIDGDGTGVLQDSSGNIFRVNTRW
jgi:hypothetical protein